MDRLDFPQHLRNQFRNNGAVSECEMVHRRSPFSALVYRSENPDRFSESTASRFSIAGIRRRHRNLWVDA
jgi:hypothetical protein